MARLRLASLAATVAYADIFDYPLTKEEIRLWSIKRTISFSSMLGIEKADEYFFLSGRKYIVSQRKKRHEASLAKWRIAKGIGWWLRFIPTIQLVGVTGGLAMDNADSGDDIDLFIISSRNALWTTRLLATFIVDFLGKRRKPGETVVADKVCLNMFMSEDSLRIPKKEHDLFAAHEVLQMKPLWVQGNIYTKFLINNRWVEKYLPNAWKQKTKNITTRFTIHYSLFAIFEPLAKLLQLWYMRKRRTTEVVSDSVIRFHPRDARIWIKEELRRRLDLLDVPLDKIFYHG